MATEIRRSFASGEISSRLQHRADLQKWLSSLIVCRNYIVPLQGGVENRPGTRFVCEVKDSTKAVRLIEFNFGLGQTYALEFGDFYMRVIKGGAQVTEAAKAIEGITNALPAVVTITGHGFANGDEVRIAGVGGMTELNGQNFKIVGVAANTFQLQFMDGTNVDSSGFGVFTIGGTAARVFTLTTPYAVEDLPELRFAQSADVVTITHLRYDPRELARLGDASWTLTVVALAPTVAPPHGITYGGGLTGGGGRQFRWVVTAITDSGEESLPAREATVAIANVNAANPVQVDTGVAHNYQTGDQVFISGSVQTQLNGRMFTIIVLDADSFTLNGENGTGRTTGAGGTVARLYAKVNDAQPPTSTALAIITIPQISNAVRYGVYRAEEGGEYTFVGYAKLTPFRDGVAIPPATGDTPPVDRILFVGAGNFPLAVEYYQQRLVFANSDNDPETIWASQIGRYKNFTVHVPARDDDAVTIVVASRQVNRVLHLVQLPTVLVALTSGGVVSFNGDEAGTLKPTAINSRQHGTVGAGRLRPLRIGESAIYVAADERTVRDLAFELTSEAVRGVDLTIFAEHLFAGHTLVDWAFQERPNSIVWAVRDDGTLLGLTYLAEQEILAWHRHDTDGLIENVCSIPEGDEHALYWVVKRTVDGHEVRYIERMASRALVKLEDLVMLDCSLSYDGRNTDPSRTMTLTGGTDWDYTETISVVDSAGAFSGSEVGKEIHLTGVDDEGNEVIIRMSIDSIDILGNARGKPNRTVPVAMQNAGFSTWSLAIKVLTGLQHLEAKAVGVIGDGHVVASPNNAAYNPLSIENGILTLERAYGVIHVGLPYTYDIKTLRLESPQAETLIDKRANIGRVTLGVSQSRGAWAGPAAPEDHVDYDPLAPDPLLGLVEVKVRSGEGYDVPVELATGTLDVRISTSWRSRGSVFLRGVDPVPVSIVTIAPAGVIPVRG
jgi:hypothetical protein